MSDGIEGFKGDVSRRPQLFGCLPDPGPVCPLSSIFAEYVHRRWVAGFAAACSRPRRACSRRRPISVLGRPGGTSVKVNHQQFAQGGKRRSATAAAQVGQGEGPLPVPALACACTSDTSRGSVWAGSRTGFLMPRSFCWALGHFGCHGLLSPAQAGECASAVGSL